MNFDDLTGYQQQKVSRVELKKSDSKKETNSSDKPWVK